MQNLFRVLGVAMVVSAFSVGAASAAVITGKVTLVGTLSEEKDAGGSFHARLRVRINGRCAEFGPIRPSDSLVERYVVIRSGNIAGYPHNGVNMKNAYSTLVSAFLAGKNVQIDGLPNCSTISEIHLNLWVGAVSVF